MAADEQSKAATEALEVRLLALLDDTGSQDLGASAANTTIGHVRDSRALLKNVARDASGGPAPMPVYLVINPIQEAHLLTDLGVADASTTMTRPISSGLTQELIENAPALDDAFFGNVLRVPTFITGYIGQTVGSITAPALGGMFSSRALILGVAAEWDVEPFSEVEWPGLIIRAMTDYGVRIGPYPSWVVQFDTDTVTL